MVVHMRKRTFPIIGTKSSILWDEETDAWVYISGEPERAENPKSYYKAIPTLYRAVNMRSRAISGLPWSIYKGKREIDTSDDYQNKLGLVKNVNTMLYLIEASLTLTGKAYWKREKNPAGFDKLRHLAPGSLQLDERQASQGNLVWERQDAVTQQVKRYTPDEIIYYWYPDPYVEIGPPLAWPVQSALAACGVLANVDEFARNFFKRGAVKAMLFAMEGIPQAEAEKFESWWKRFVSGINNAFSTRVLNATKVEPVVVGEGMKELENTTITADKREEIAVALDMPISLIFSNAANYATAERDKLNWYEDFVKPESIWIEAVMNEQIFEPLGYSFRFRPDSLDIFQEDETKRAAAMSQFMDALDKAGTIEMAQALFIIYGIEVTPEAEALIVKHFEKKDERSEQIQANMEQPQDEEPEDEQEEEAPPPPVRTVDIQQLGRELSIWQSKCLSAVKQGKPPADVPFVPVHISHEKFAAIKERLQEAATDEQVKAAFIDGQYSVIELTPQADGMAMLAEQLKRANDLLEREYASTAASA